MKELKISSIILIAVLIAVVAIIYILLSPLYKTGSPVLDAVAVIVGVIALMVKYLPQPNAGSDSTQFYARTQVIAAAGMAILLLAILHTLLCVILSYSLTIPFLILLGIVILYHGFRISAVNVGTSIQIATDERHQMQRENRQNLAALVERSAKTLQADILALQTEDYTSQQETISSIKNVVLAVKGLPANRVNQLQDLQMQLSKWSTSLEMASVRIQNLSEEEKVSFLKEITYQANEMLRVVKSSK